MQRPYWEAHSDETYHLKTGFLSIYSTLKGDLRTSLKPDVIRNIPDPLKTDVFIRDAGWQLSDQSHRQLSVLSIHIKQLLILTRSKVPE